MSVGSTSLSGEFSDQGDAKSDDESCIDIVRWDNSLCNDSLKKRKWEKTYELPPCRICGGKGTGLHYGVNTCEACKGFFRRTLSKSSRLHCKKEKNCSLVVRKRTICSYCRFQKCVALGMSMSGVRHGRTPLDKVRQDVEEVRRIRQNEEYSDSTSSPQKPCSFEDISVDMKQRLQSPIMSMSNVDITDAMNALERNTNLLQTENITSHEYTIECITERERTSISETNIPILVHCDQILAKEKEMIELNNILLDSFKTCTSVWNSIDLEMMELNESYLAFHRPGPAGVIGDFFNVKAGEEGIDYFNKCFRNRERTIRQLLKYAKTIPGYRQLHLEDQITLFKCSIAELTFVNRFWMIDVEREVLVIPTNNFTTISSTSCACDEPETNIKSGEIGIGTNTYGKNDNIFHQIDIYSLASNNEDMLNKESTNTEQITRTGQPVSTVFGTELAALFIRVAKRLQRAKLNGEEIAVLQALVLFTSDKCELRDTKRVEEIHDKLLDILKWLLHKNHPDDQMVMARLVSGLTEMRSLTQVGDKFFGQLRLFNTQRNLVNIPELFMEVHNM